MTIYEALGVVPIINCGAVRTFYGNSLMSDAVRRAMESAADHFVLMEELAEAAGIRILQLLPINEMRPGETSPYSALSAMAIDPQFLALRDVEDFVAIGGEAAFEPPRHRHDVGDLADAPSLR